MKFERNQRVNVRGVVRILVRPVNTHSAWLLSREAEGSLYANEADMTPADGSRVSTKSWGNYWGHQR